MLYWQLVSSSPLEERVGDCYKHKQNQKHIGNTMAKNMKALAFVDPRVGNTQRLRRLVVPSRVARTILARPNSPHAQPYRTAARA